MKIKIEEREYEVAGIGRASLFDLLEMKRQTKDLCPPNGMDVDRMQEVLGRASEDATGTSILSDTEGMVALGALIWLTRRKAGEALSFEDACSFPLDAMEFVAEDGDEPPVPDPH